MGLASLDAALSGLRVSQQAISVISNNISNVGTPGFTRKILPQASQSIGGVTVGVQSQNIVRNVDLNLQRDLWTQVSSVSFFEVQEATLKRVEQFHGAPDQEISIAAELSRLRDSFASLADSPEDTFAQAGVVGQAEDLANRINDFSVMITTFRNDAQDDIDTVVGRINDLITQIAESNRAIEQAVNASRSTALFDDTRDQAVKELSELIEIDFFTRGSGVMVVQTSSGVQLADEDPTLLTFSPGPISAQNAYPLTAAGVFVGNPVTNPQEAIDITDLSPGGQLGGLIELRDTILPKQTAQMDELAHKLALRFEQQGLRLFTDASGGVPLDTAPDPTTNPPTPVEYVGFSASIRVNQAILNDNSILQTGTINTDLPAQAGSNEVIRRVIEFAFGDVEHQQAIGSVDIRSNATGGVSLQDWLGVFSENTVTTTRDIASIGPDLITAPGSPFAVPGADTFTITIDPAGEGAGPIGPLVVDLNAVPPAGNATAADLATFIDGLDANISASINAFGQLQITSRFDLQITDVDMGTTGFQFLGLPQGTLEATDPFFDVQVGNDPPVRITIDPGDTEVELLDKLDLAGVDTLGVPGLAVEDFTANADGFVRLRPGDNFSDPTFGGDLKITSGPFEADGTGTINAQPPGAGVGPGTVPSGVNLISAIFGSFTAGPPLVDDSPIANVTHSSVTDASLGTPQTIAFRGDLLGPGADISTDVVGSTKLVDFAQKIINQQSQELVSVERRQADEDSLREVLERQLLDESSVNIDEELSNLIVVQTAFSASARVVEAVDQLFRELLDAFR